MIIEYVMNNFQLLFGSPIAASIFALSIIIWVMLIARAGRAAILLVLVPAVGAMAVEGSQYFGVPRWVAILLFAGIGVIFAGVYWSLMR